MRMVSSVFTQNFMPVSLVTQTFKNVINTKYTMVSSGFIQNFTPISSVTQTFSNVINTKYTWTST